MPTEDQPSPDEEQTRNLLRTLSLEDQATIGLVVCGTEDWHKSPVGSAERPVRIAKCLEQLKLRHMDFVHVQSRPRSATDFEILRVHTRAHLKRLTRLVIDRPPELLVNSKDHDRFVNAAAGEEFDSVFMTSRSLDAARLSAGAVLDAVDAVCERRVRCVAAAIRPPGHHAESHCAMGFCLFNNVALAARRAVDVHKCKRVLIVDFDIHHGNGTQRIFWAEDRVLYVSVHRWDNAGFYPYSTDAGCTVTGPASGPGAGKTVNVGFSGGAPMGDAEYLSAWERVVMPVSTEYNPDLVLVSAGFDACEGDSIGQYAVTPRCFATMVSQLTRLAEGRCVMMLEGGYNVEQTALSFALCAEALAGKLGPHDVVAASDDVKPEARTAIDETIDACAKHWKCFQR